MWFSISLPVPGCQKAFPAHPCTGCICVTSLRCVFQMSPQMSCIGGRTVTFVASYATEAIMIMIICSQKSWDFIFKNPWILINGKFRDHRILRISLRDQIPNNFIHFLLLKKLKKSEFWVNSEILSPMEPMVRAIRLCRTGQIPQNTTDTVPVCWEKLGWGRNQFQGQAQAKGRRTPLAFRCLNNCEWTIRLWSFCFFRPTVDVSVERESSMEVVV